MFRRANRFAAAAVLVAITTAVHGLPLMPARGAQRPPAIWRDVTGAPLPIEREPEILDFLSTAEVDGQSRFDEDGGLRGSLGREEVGIGSYHVRLRLGDSSVNAVFRAFDQRSPVATFRDGSTEVQFRDFGLFEVAAYRLARLLGLDLVPPVVERRIGSSTGSLQISVEGAFSESQRADRGIADPAVQRWHRQLAIMNVFDALIGNRDRNRRNLLYDELWRVWLTDHSRAFRASGTIEDREELQAIERGLWQRLQALRPEAVREALGRYLTTREMRALLQRRERLIEHFEELIAERGDRRVLFAY